MSSKVEIVEVGLRDGLQNEDPIPTEEKIKLFRELKAAGLRQIEVASFSRPDLVPAMADSREMMEGLQDEEDVRVVALVPNERGYQTASEVGARSLALFVACTDEFARANQKMSLQDSIRRISSLLRQAKDDGLWVRLYFSVCWYCHYAGRVAEDQVLRIVEEVFQGLADQVAISDTVGRANEEETASLLRRLQDIVPLEKIAVHMHDTDGNALDNVLAAVDEGVRIVDGSIAGLGACQFSGNPRGNVATEDVVFTLSQQGIETGVNLDALWEVVEKAQDLLGRPLGGRTRDQWASLGK